MHWKDWRNRLVADPRFQSFAARFPLTKPIASAKARQAFDLAAGFVYSQVLLACVELDLLERLREGPQPADTLASASQLTPDAMDRLLLAAASLDLVERRGEGLWGLGMAGAALLGNPGALAMVAHHKLVYRDLSDPVSLLRQGPSSEGLARFWAYARQEERSAISDTEVAAYSTLMDQSQTLVRQDVLDFFSLAGVRQMMDVGGGEGGFCLAAAERYPQLRGWCVDLPAVARRAQARFETQGLSDRLSAKPCDFKAQELPSGADMVTLVRVLHDHDDAPALDLLRAIRRSLALGGRLLIAEPMSGAAGAEPMGDAYFGFYLLAMGSGRPRLAREISQMLKAAGFTSIRPIKTPRPLLVSLIEAS